MARSPSEAPTARDSRSPSIFPSSPPDSPPREPTPAITSIAGEVNEADSATRVSFYVQAVDEMVAAVLGPGREAHLFTEVEQLAVRRFEELDYEARYLFVRLYLRKHGWIRLSSIGYEADISDLGAASTTLCAALTLGSSASGVAGPSSPRHAGDTNVIDLTDSDDEGDVVMDLGAGEPDFSRLAFDEATLAEGTSEDLLKLLSKEEIVTLGKKMKVFTGKGTRRDYIKGLLKTSNQATLSFFTSMVKGKEKATGAKAGHVGLNFDSKGNKAKQSSVVAIHALKMIGPCIQISAAYTSLFDRLSLVYHRTAFKSTTGTTSLTASLLARFGKRIYPAYTVKRTFAIFPDRETLLKFEDALAAERDIEAIVETKFRQPAARKPEKDSDKKRKVKTLAQIKEDDDLRAEQNDVFRTGVKIAEEAYKPWCAAVRAGATADLEEPDEHKKALLFYRRRFDPGWPLTRVVAKGAALYARLGEHDREKEFLLALLKQTTFRRGKRGAWYERLALVLMEYPSKEESSNGLSEGKKRKLATARRSEALEVCLRGLDDPYTHLVYRKVLQKRVKRIESLQKVDPAQRHEYDKAGTKDQKRVIVGTRIDAPEVGKKSVWQGRDPNDGVSVETLALEYYEDFEGLKGIHSEGSILTTIFAMCFWDILFMDIDGVFETAYQAAPLDLATDAFMMVRKNLIEKRLDSIAKGKAIKIMTIPDDRERPKGTFCVGVAWDKYSKKDLHEIVTCIGGESLAVILRLFCEDYAARTGGAPDLCLWDPETERAVFVEVKGPGDRLSATQTLWIQELTAAGIEVEVCSVMTEEDKDLMDEKAAERRAKAKEKKAKGKKRGRDDSDEDDE